MKLETKINNETCILKIKAMNNIVYNEKDYRCLNCSGYDEFCEDYKKVKNSGMRYAYLNLYGDNNGNKRY